ncbi:MAG: hypothetical protein NZ853_01700 [Leptospiraceae bacterium]|nr:hypothetical protein [Leptospiraceae bacterium]MDW7976059.1 hypothetical protein [Leptospiraceae bacterium]
MKVNESKLLTLVDQSILVKENLNILPIVHGSLEFTILVKKHFFDNPPQRVLIEAPYYLSNEIHRAIPFVSSYPVIKIETEIPSYFILEPLEPIVEAIRNCYELDIPYHLIDNITPNFHVASLYRIQTSFPDTYVLHYLSLEELVELYRKKRNVKKNLYDLYRETFMALQTKKLLSIHSEEEILLICGIEHYHNIVKFLDYPEEKLQDLLDSLQIQLANQSLYQENQTYKIEIFSLSDQSPEVLMQPGYYNNLWNKFRNEPQAWKYFDRVLLNRNLYKATKNEYEIQSGDFVPPQKEKLFFQFARNLSLIYKKLIPNPLILISAAKGFVNDNFAKIFYEKITSIEKSSSPFPELKLSLDELGLDKEIIRFRLLLFTHHNKMVKEMKSKIHKEEYQGQWKELWNHSGLCSYPPEDVVIEEFGNYLRKRALSIVKSQDTRTLPFTANLYDGIDYRETIRNYYKNTIYVKEAVKRNWDAGNIVIIFSLDEEKYHWKSVWWGEHSEEGDMAFYATDPNEMIVGPGIARCFYGGFMLSYPPGRLSYIWDDYELRNFRKPNEKLLAAAILYNTKSVVIYVADKPHSQKMNYFASRFGQKIAYIPISTLNQEKISRIRRFHVLSDHSKRKDADKYIW